MQFTITHKDISTKARLGELHTGHGIIETPVFMPVGTVGTVKAVHFSELRSELEARIILSNTYHLYLRPGIDIIAAAGGLHKFNSWDRAILTDSGGYQVFSLASNRKLTDDGAIFRSHIDGSKHIFTPEKVIDIQRQIGADIIMSFDECTPYPADYAYSLKSLKLTHNWLKRCYTQFHNTQAHYDYSQSFFPIVQGSVYKDLRVDSAKYISDFGADGNAIGGLSVGEPTEMMYDMIDCVVEHLPDDKPRYLMGVGTPINLLEGISRGIDMFDCVMPTRNARNGMLFTSEGTINIKNKKWEKDFSLIDAAGTTFVDKTCSKAYLRHLIISNEILGLQIASLHNLGFYHELMRQARHHIRQGDFEIWKRQSIEKLKQRL